MATTKKSSQRVSLTIFALRIGLFMLLLLYVNVVSGVSHEMTAKSALLRIGGIAVGGWVSGEWIVKRSVSIIGLPVKGALGVALAGVGGLLLGVSAYTLVASMLR